MLKRHKNTVFCPDCGQSWHVMSGQSAGDSCPSVGCPSNESTPLGIVHRAIVESEGLGIHAIGASGALTAMLHHWKDHLGEGHKPSIIDTDIRFALSLLNEMRVGIMQKIESGRLAEPVLMTELLPISVLNNNSTKGNFTTLVDAVQEGNKVISDSFASEQPLSDLEIMVSFEDTEVTLAEARKQLSRQTLSEAGDILEAIAVHGEFDKQTLVNLAKCCRVVLSNFA